MGGHHTDRFFRALAVASAYILVRRWRAASPSGRCRRRSPPRLCSALRLRGVAVRAPRPGPPPELAPKSAPRLVELKLLPRCCNFSRTKRGLTQHPQSPVVCWQGQVTEAILVIFPCAPHVQTSETGTEDQQLHQDYVMCPSGHHLTADKRNTRISELKDWIAPAYCLLVTSCSLMTTRDCGANCDFK
ncbi:hypothetical protein PVAP13_2NG476600 [Panicum virgatum]|uniref:Uncharacterized protein n=1 Tax=Panicum virgatum TaxID=38727 RepID=A0A8T0VJ98_PANVG|nr:hypothetical protein PVAP13_2NG476600 [Panicum virgatum]